MAPDCKTSYKARVIKPLQHWSRNGYSGQCRWGTQKRTHRQGPFTSSQGAKATEGKDSLCNSQDKEGMALNPNLTSP